MNHVEVYVPVYEANGTVNGQVKVSSSQYHRNTVFLTIGEAQVYVIASDLLNAVKAVDEHTGYDEKPRDHQRD